MSELSCAVESADLHGEGPVWSPLERRLYWFDIAGKRLSWLEPSSGDRGGWGLALRASAAAPLAEGGLLVATEGGLARFDAAVGELRLIEPVRTAPGFRSNGGRIDIGGRFWWSVVDDEGGLRPGGLYRTDGGGTVRVLGGLRYPNGMACSPDGRRLYVSDAARRRIMAYPVDPKSGDLGAGEALVVADDEPGVPDGLAVDAAGYIWSAQRGGWRLARYSPAGRLDRIVDLPVENPTSCAFGGEGLATLYVASGREGLRGPELADQPQAGGLFAYDAGTPGLALPAFSGGRFSRG
jgi:sugar lactone lactonase YvrE